MTSYWAIFITFAYFAVGLFINDLVFDDERIEVVVLIFWLLIAAITIAGIIFYAIPRAMAKAIKTVWHEYKKK